MPKCYHCGEEFDELYKCNECNQYYCYLHKNPINHECSIVKESLDLQYSSNELSENYLRSHDPSNADLTGNASHSQHQQPIFQPTHYDDSDPHGNTDGTFTWYRRESNIPDDAFSPDSGIEFKGILLPYKSEFLHLLIGSVLIYIIGLIGFYNPQNQQQLNALGFGWIIFMVAGFYTTAFLFHEFGHRQVAIHFGLQTKFRLLKYGMIITAFGLLMGIISIASGVQGLPGLALPGAVVVLGLDKIDKKTGLCKAAGPTVNSIYGSILFTVSFLIPIFPINLFIGMAASINFMLGLFNLIPIGILDGENIFKWNKQVYFFLVSSMLILIIINYICIYLPPASNPYYI